MVIKRVIVHELVKNPQSKGASLDLSTGICMNGPITEKLITELDSRYNRLEIINARFKTSAGFKVAMAKYYKAQNDQSFIDFTKDVMNELEGIIKEVWFAKGGYFVFADYEGYVGVFLIRHKEGMLFKKKKGTIIVNPAEGIDFETMALACRVDIVKFANDEGRYLSFVSDRNEPISQYFIHWFSVQDVEDNRKDSFALMDILEDIAPPEDKDKNEFMEEVYDEIINNDGEVNLQTLGKKFYGDDQRFITHAKQRQSQINSKFKADDRMLKKFPFIRAKADEIDIRFPRKLYKMKIRLDKKKPNLIIIDSLPLANELNKKLGLNIPGAIKAMKAVGKIDSQGINKIRHPGGYLPQTDSE